MDKKLISPYQDWGLLVLRIALGVIFIVHGWGKLFGHAPGMEGFTMMLAGLAFPAPALFAYLVALVEFIGGIAVLLGVWTKLFGLLIAVDMIVAFLKVKQGLPAGDPDVALFAIAVALSIMGSGAYALHWKGEESETHTPSSTTTHHS